MHRFISFFFFKFNRNSSEQFNKNSCYIFLYITHLIHDETLFNFKYHRTKRRINFLHSSSFRSLRFYFRSSFLSLSLSLLFSFSLSVSICLFVYLSVCTNLYRLLFLSLSAVLLHEQKQRQIRPDLYNIFRQTSEKRKRKNVPYRSISKILFSNPSLKKKMSDVWLTLSLNYVRFHY